MKSPLNCRWRSLSPLLTLHILPTSLYFQVCKARRINSQRTRHNRLHYCIAIWRVGVDDGGDKVGEAASLWRFFSKDCSFKNSLSFPGLLDTGPTLPISTPERPKKRAKGTKWVICKMLLDPLEEPVRIPTCPLQNPKAGPRRAHKGKLGSVRGVSWARDLRWFGTRDRTTISKQSTMRNEE